MPRDVLLNVILSKDRNNPGWLRVEVDGAPTVEFRVLGRGSTKVGKKPTGNPTRNPLSYAGDTPVGDFVSPEIVDTTAWNKDSYGPWGAVRLHAVGGDAVLAQTLGRKGLLIHGGAPGRFAGYRSTLGCLRVSNDDMLSLRRTLFAAGEDSSQRMSRELAVRVTVREF